LPTFVAHADFRFEAERLEEGGRKLRDLAKAAETVGFDFTRGHIEPVAPGIDPGEGDWTGYGTTTD
jgi:hypothetical protein